MDRKLMAYVAFTVVILATASLIVGHIRAEQNTNEVYEIEPRDMTEPPSDSNDAPEVLGESVSNGELIPGYISEEEFDPETYSKHLVVSFFFDPLSPQSLLLDHELSLYISEIPDHVVVIRKDISSEGQKEPVQEFGKHMIVISYEEKAVYDDIVNFEGLLDVLPEVITNSTDEEQVQ